MKTWQLILDIGFTLLIDSVYYHSFHHPLHKFVGYYYIFPKLSGSTSLFTDRLLVFLTDSMDDNEILGGGNQILWLSEENIFFTIMLSCTNMQFSTLKTDLENYLTKFFGLDARKRGNP